MISIKAVKSFTGAGVKDWGIRWFCFGFLKHGCDRLPAIAGCWSPFLRVRVRVMFRIRVRGRVRVSFRVRFGDKGRTTRVL